MMEASERPMGRHRGVGWVVLWMFLTLGIYALYWIYISFAELRAHRGTGVSGIVGMLLALIPVSIFLLPSYVGNTYAEAGKPKPMTGLTGVWALVPLVGSLIWVIKVQGALNHYWGQAEVQTAPAPAMPAEMPAEMPAAADEPAEMPAAADEPAEMPAAADEPAETPPPSESA